MDVLDTLAIVCWSLTLIIKALILVCFLYQCSNYKQLNYDLTITYSTLTAVALIRLIITMILVCIVLIYYVTSIKIYLMIAEFMSSLSSPLQCVFFVLCLHMTFLHSRYQISKGLLLLYAIRPTKQ